MFTVRALPRTKRDGRRCRCTCEFFPFASLGTGTYLLYPSKERTEPSSGMVWGSWYKKRYDSGKFRGVEFEQWINGITGKSVVLNVWVRTDKSGQPSQPIFSITVSADGDNSDSATDVSQMNSDEKEKLWLKRADVIPAFSSSKNISQQKLQAYQRQLKKSKVSTQTKKKVKSILVSKKWNCLDNINETEDPSADLGPLTRENWETLFELELSFHWRLKSARFLQRPGCEIWLDCTFGNHSLIWLYNRSNNNTFQLVKWRRSSDAIL